MMNLRQNPQTESLLAMGSDVNTIPDLRRSEWEWGGETSFSHDSGWVSADFNDVGSSLGSAPDLLDCLIMEDVEERIREIKVGAAKPSEIICLKNLVNLLNLQQNDKLKMSCDVPATLPSNMRAITRTGGGAISSNNVSAYHHDLQRLLEQETSLSFPGQMPPVTVKLLPPGHLPAETSSVTVKLLPPGHPPAETSSATVKLLPPGHPPAEMSSAPQKSLSIQSVSATQPSQERYKSTKSRKFNWNLSRDVIMRTEEGFYQLRLLQKERIRYEDLLMKSSGMPSIQNRINSCRLNDRSLKDLLLAMQDEMEAILLFVQSIEADMKKSKRFNLVKTLYESVENWSYSQSKMMEHSRNSFCGPKGLLEKLKELKELNSCTRHMRTAIFAIPSGLTK